MKQNKPFNFPRTTQKTGMEGNIVEIENEEKKLNLPYISSNEGVGDDSLREYFYVANKK